MDRLIIDQGMKEFLDTVNEPSQSLPDCVAQTNKALSLVAEELRLGKAVLHTVAPSTKLRPEGLDNTSVLYEYDGEIFSDTLEINNTLPDGGTCSAIIYPRGNTPFNDIETKNLTFVFKEVFYKFSRTSVTSLLNRVIMTDLETGASTLAALMRFAGMKLQMGQIKDYYVVFFNIHNFKYVNKIFSYAEGDVVLRDYTQLLISKLDKEEILARLGGDNYVALVKKDHALEFIKFIQEVRLTHEAEGKKKSFVFGATVGYSKLEDITSPRDVMSRSSIAFQAARGMGGGSVVEYSDRLRTQLMARQEVISKFQFALASKEFVVYYQPKVDVKTKKVCGAEALIRWKQNGELVPPFKFIPVLEQEGSIVMLDYYVLEQVCAFLRKRIDEGKEPITISVNFSRRHLEEDDLVDKTLDIIDRYNLDHKYIEIELTESNDYQNYQKMRDLVEDLSKNNVSTSMDDFGTGFSSLNMIKEVNLNVIKIDKSLIPLDSEYPDKEKDQILFESLITLIHQLGKVAIAEGVETKEQLKAITDAGCKIVQGYIFDKPLTEDEFKEKLQTGYSDKF